MSRSQARFYDTANVFLLVKTARDGSASAGFFFWDNGRIDAEFSFLEFPFDARQLTGLRVKPAPRATAQALSTTDPSREPHTGAEYEPLAIPREIPGTFEPEAPQQARGGPNRHVWRAGLFALGMIALGAVGYQGYLAWAPRGGAAASQASDAPALALQVGRQGADLRVSWNRNSPAILQATDGVLSIRDGDAQQQELHLDSDQLRHGSVTYTPATAGVRFRLEVTAPGDSKTSETVLALTAARPALPASSQPPARGPSPQSDAAAATSRGPSKDEPLRVTMLDPPARSPLGDAPAAPPPSSPATPSLLYLPPRPVRQVQPVLPYTVRKLIAAQIDVSVKVWISNTGTVVKAEPVPTGQLVSSSLVSAAQRAALRWRFAPAVRGTETVPSGLILKFQYRPVAR